MGAERLKSLRRGVLAMRKMLREMETELEKEIAECVKNGRLESDHQTEEIREISRLVIGRLNFMTGKNFNPETESTLHLIRQRIEEGHSKEEMLYTVDEMCSRWIDDKEHRLFLRPETLFGVHFESYLEETLSLLRENETLRRIRLGQQGGNEIV